MSFRKIQRNFLKKWQGNNKINKTWRNFQVEKYGLEQYIKMYNKNQGKHKGRRINTKTVFSV